MRLSSVLILAFFLQCAGALMTEQELTDLITEHFPTLEKFLDVSQRKTIEDESVKCLPLAKRVIEGRFAAVEAELAAAKNCPTLHEAFSPIAATIVNRLREMTNIQAKTFLHQTALSMKSAMESVKDLQMPKDMITIVFAAADWARQTATDFQDLPEEAKAEVTSVYREFFSIAKRLRPEDLLGLLL